MTVRYLFSSPEGDIPADAELLQRPFLLGPSTPHPFLTLEDYFIAVERFLLGDGSRSLLSALGRTTGHEGRGIGPEDLRIRMEKHGAFYQVGSVETVLPAVRARFSLLSASSPRGRSLLRHEYSMLRRLYRSHGLPLIPSVYHLAELPLRRGASLETMVVVLGEWFEDYHEWHFSLGEGKNQVPVLWDHQRGLRPLSREEVFELIRQAARILTLYYDTRTFGRISPWHHGAGDFVVRARNGQVDVRLTTVRGYEPMPAFQGEGREKAPTAHVFFLLDLATKMRIDKQDGTGEALFAEAFVVEATLKGFFDALGLKEADGSLPPGKARELASLLSSFSPGDLRKLLEALPALRPEDDPEDGPLLCAHLESHAADLHRAIQNTL